VIARLLRHLPLFLAAIATAAALACAKPPPAFEEVPPAEELYQEGLAILEDDRALWVIPWTNYTQAIETFQTIIDNYPYSDYAVLAELRIADAYFDDGKYEEALSYYRDFGDLHPQHEKVPYTIYRSALCYERRVRSTNRDQTATQEALVYLDRLLSKHPHSEYARDAEELWRELRLHLAEHTMGIGDYYLDREEYASATVRYRTVLNEYPGLGLDAEALYKLGRSLEAMDRRDEATSIYQVIVENYAESDVADDARDRID